LASALNVIHNFTTPSPLQDEDTNATYQKFTHREGRLKVQDADKKFGRHGDLKPENILRFEGNNGDAGILQITNFSLGRFHRFESRSTQDPRRINGSSAYAPPELALALPVSRAYDIWSLGCIFLEFITWLLEGSAGLESFTSSRLLEGEDGIIDDVYFTLVKSKESPRPHAEV
jgi:serine/threonine protein kinase